MNLSRFARLLLVVLSSTLNLGATGADQPDGSFALELAPGEEERLARTALPEHLQANASVWILGAKGYELASLGTNGFNCLVSRDGAAVLAPLCYDQVGSKTLLQADLKRAAAVMSGKTLEEAKKLVDAAYESGELTAPAEPGLAYMLSEEFFDHSDREPRQVYPPHVMFYAPYKTPEDFGFSPDSRGSTTQPWILNGGTPKAYVIVVPQ